MARSASPVRKELSLYDRLGGKEAIAAAVERFYESVLVDPELQPFFTQTNLKWLKERQNQFLTQALGGPALYKGRPMNLKTAVNRFQSRCWQELGQREFWV